MDDLLFDRKSLLNFFSSFDNLNGIKINAKTRGQSQLYLLAKKTVDEKFVIIFIFTEICQSAAKCSHLSLQKPHFKK